jgi:glutathione synthase/RimK-type ligase-like ATP-grasp enzyme
MVDKNRSNAYIWYCGATDGTGKRLAEALGCKHGSKKPVQKNTAMVIGWGAKTKEDVTLGSLPVLNHPDKIRGNRNKFNALQVMEKAGVSVAKFIAAESVEQALNKGHVTLPLIGRTRYHQGGKGFWECPTLTHVRNAINEGAQYFQNLIEIKDEFRMHTFEDGGVIYGVKKVQRTRAEMEDAFVRHEVEKHKRAAEKNGEEFDEAALTKVFKRQAKTWAANGANQMVRSNRMGWRFARVKQVTQKIEAECVKALSALGLTFGAVDCCTDASGKVWIIEVNTGPGLEETPFNAYVEKFKELCAAALEPKTKARTAAKKVTSAKAKPATKGGAKEQLAAKLALAQEMIEKADDEEAEVANRLFAKMFGDV